MKKIPVLISVLILAAGCCTMNKFLGLKDDNVVEEVVENVIQQETGLDIDLTPDTPEQKK